jgi:hypothetical protein
MNPLTIKLENQWKQKWQKRQKRFLLFAIFVPIDLTLTEFSKENSRIRLSSSAIGD